MVGQDLVEVLKRVEILGISERLFGFKHVVITGARGFLGSAFTHVFSALGSKVTAIDRYALAAELGAALPLRLPGVEHVDHDVTKPIEIPGPVDLVLSLAAIASPVHYARRPLECLDVITAGTRNMIELAERKNALFFLSSTSELYGDSGWEGHPMREEHLGVLDPWNVRGKAYDVPKLLSEALASIFTDRKVTTRTVRYFNVYAAPMARGDYRVMTKFAAAVIDGKPLTVHGYGDFPTRSFTYITDALVGTLLVLARGDSYPYNIGNPEETSMRVLAQVFKEVGEKLGRAVEITHEDPPPEYAKQPRRRIPDIQRLRGIGFTPEIPLRQGVERFLRWALEAYAL